MEPTADFLENNNEFWTAIKEGKFLDNLNNN
jgi:hypothetical protein